MTDLDRNRQREHWQAIAEQLGLAPEEDVSAEQEEPKERSAPKGMHAPPSAASELEPEAATAKAPPAEQLEPAGEVQVEQKQALKQAEPGVAGDQTATPIASAPAIEEAVVPRRGQRRRQTRETQAPESVGEEPGTSGLPESTLSEETRGRPDRQRGRGRNKKRSKDSAQASPAEEAEMNPPEAEPVGQDDADAEDLSSLTSWNVPSWNELIASLYRPER
jgi:hypothetical protein